MRKCRASNTDGKWFQKKRLKERLKERLKTMKEKQVVQCAPTAWMLGERRRWLALRRSGRRDRRGGGAAEGTGCCSTAMKEKQMRLSEGG